MDDSRAAEITAESVVCSGRRGALCLPVRQPRSWVLPSGVGHRYRRLLRRPAAEFVRGPAAAGSRSTGARPRSTRSWRGEWRLAASCCRGDDARVPGSGGRRPRPEGIATTNCRASRVLTVEFAAGVQPARGDSPWCDEGRATADDVGGQPGVPGDSGCHRSMGCQVALIAVGDQGATWTSEELVATRRWIRSSGTSSDEDGAGAAGAPGLGQLVPLTPFSSAQHAPSRRAREPLELVLVAAAAGRQMTRKRMCPPRAGSRIPSSA